VGLVVLAGLGVPYLQASATERSLIGKSFFSLSRQCVADVTGMFPGASLRRKDLVPPLVPRK
jgi:hypothetical protein